LPARFSPTTESEVIGALVVGIFPTGFLIFFPTEVFPVERGISTFSGLETSSLDTTIKIQNVTDKFFFLIAICYIYILLGALVVFGFFPTGFVITFPATGIFSVVTCSGMVGTLVTAI